MLVKQPKRQSGFTMIEIMVVVIIIGLLAAMVAPKVLPQKDKAAEIKAQADIKAISSALAMYKLDNFEYPSTAQGIRALVTNPGKSTWRGYLDKVPKDPWGKEYQYAFPGSHNSGGFDLWSLGSDGNAGGEGSGKDISNWESQAQ